MSIRPVSAPRDRRSSVATREHVLGVAHELFYWHGIRATGVDTVAANAGIAPTTLYRLFVSKDDLVTAYVQRAHDGYLDWITEMTVPNVGSARVRILRLVDGIVAMTRPEYFRGCPFLMALAEYPDRTTGPHMAAAATKAWVRKRMRELAREFAAETSVVNPNALADQLALVIEGVYASAAALGTRGPVVQAHAVAEALLGAA